MKAPSQAVGYLISEYPAPSHTFIRREVEALRREGLTIRTYSLRSSDGSGLPFDEDDAYSTFCLRNQSTARMLGLLIPALVRYPLRSFATLALALKHRVPGGRAFLWALFHFVEAVILARQLRADGVGRLHNHFGNSGATVGLLTAHFNQIPWSLTLHGISEFDYPAGNLLARKIEQAAFVACVSYFGMAQAMRLCSPQLWSKLHIVRCGIDPRSLPTRDEACDRTRVKIVCVGRLSAEKGQLGLLEAAGRLFKRGIGFDLVIVGDGPQRSLLESQAIQLGLQTNVTFLGALDECATLTVIAGADVLVLPSFMEGLPVVLMEAMALHVPVVSSRVAGIPELVSDGETGLLFHPADWKGLETALEMLVCDPRMRTKLAQAGFEKVSATFFYPETVGPLKRLLSPTSP